MTTSCSDKNCEGWLRYKVALLDLQKVKKENTELHEYLTFHRKQSKIHYNRWQEAAERAQMFQDGINDHIKYKNQLQDTIQQLQNELARLKGTSFSSFFNNCESRSSIHNKIYYNGT